MDEDLHEKPSSNETPNFRVVTEQLGVWYLYVSENNGVNMKNHWNNLVSGLPLFRILAMEIYNLDPMLFIAFICSKMWSGFESALLTYMSGQVLRQIEAGLSHDQPLMRPLIVVISCRLVCLMLAAYIGWWKSVPL
ncbi:hypothetical protein BDQ17DRAFT_1242063 [Cyathus striatus]|nr:hypothetical protein BDQ17DRAFT_1242063 [Cyathus striatus]